MQHAVNTNNSDKNQKAGRRKKFKGNQSERTSNSDNFKIDFSHLSEKEILIERKRIALSHKKSRKKRITLYLFTVIAITLISVLYINYSKKKSIEFEYQKITGLSLPESAQILEFKSKISSRDARTYTLTVKLNLDDLSRLKNNLNEHNFSTLPIFEMSSELRSFLKNYSDSFNEQFILKTGSKQFRFVRFYNDKTILLISNAKFLSFDPPKKVIKEGPFK